MIDTGFCILRVISTGMHKEIVNTQFHKFAHVVVFTLNKPFFLPDISSSLSVLRDSSLERYKFCGHSEREKTNAKESK